MCVEDRGRKEWMKEREAKKYHSYREYLLTSVALAVADAKSDVMVLL